MIFGYREIDLKKLGRSMIMYKLKRNREVDETNRYEVKYRENKVYL